MCSSDLRESYAKTAHQHGSGAEHGTDRNAAARPCPERPARHRQGLSLIHISISPLIRSASGSPARRARCMCARTQPTTRTARMKPPRCWQSTIFLSLIHIWSGSGEPRQRAPVQQARLSGAGCQPRAGTRCSHPVSYTHLTISMVASSVTPYIQKYHGRTMVIKYGGNAMINETLKNAVMNDLVTLTQMCIRDRHCSVPVVYHERRQK